MISQAILVLICLIPAGGPGIDGDMIHGVVVNGSRADAPVAGAEVFLQVWQDGDFMPLATTMADKNGRYSFESLPADVERLYLPGATRDGVFYPGPRLVLGPSRPHADARLVVHEAITEPNPLVALRHDIVVRPEPNLLNITESILVSNPSAFCYVGPPRENDRTVTLRLSVPSNFEKVTFHKEFFGRRFVLANGSLVTNIPWPPGERELAFTYILPVTQERQLWERPLDLPSSHVSVRVVGADAKDAACNLGSAMIPGDGWFSFQSIGEVAAGHVIRLEIGELQVPFMLYARWLALAILCGLITVAGMAAWVLRSSQVSSSGGGPHMKRAGTGQSSRRRRVRTPSTAGHRERTTGNRTRIL